MKLITSLLVTLGLSALIGCGEIENKHSNLDTGAPLYESCNDQIVNQQYGTHTYYKYVAPTYQGSDRGSISGCYFIDAPSALQYVRERCNQGSAHSATCASESSWQWFSNSFTRNPPPPPDEVVIRKPDDIVARFHARIKSQSKNFENLYLDIDGNTGDVILGEGKFSGTLWTVTQYRNGLSTYQNLGNSRYKDYYLDIDGNTGDVILHPTKTSGSYWAIDGSGIKNTAKTQFKGGFLNIDENTREIELSGAPLLTARWTFVKVN